ncbi:zinc finger protein 436-like [Teleopsis dalmanni]|uniref:zinc finger protein 436-like n=1 Tax=Teleopsis dalmanni TaxID=139649 RepID=UPI0018CCE08C|nr:zinc finger protein 436-like [Teleopsis dalmanni]XP_037934567.1 zinc finger protein 436-like [Teleopsis dalmanni]
MSTGKEFVVCRTCLTQCSDDYKSIHKQGIILGEITTLIEILRFCTDIEYLADDPSFPTHICKLCLQNLVRSYSFKKLAIETNEALHNQKQQLACSEDPHSMSEYVFEEQQYLEENGEAEELQELANAAQMRQSIENVNDASYVTLSVLHNSEDEEEPMEFKIQRGEIIDDGDVYLQEIIERHDGNTENEEEYMIQSADDNMSEEAFEPTYDDDTMSTENNETDDTSRKIRKILRSDNKISSDTNNDNGTLVRKRIKRAHGQSSDPLFKCKICKKQLSNANSFKYHMQLHSDQTPYLCSMCGAGFKTRNAYDGHLITHNPNNPNTCKICGKAYRQSSSLRTHMMSHTGEKPFQCNICGKGMTQKSGYKKHMLTHTGEKPHACDVCGREFRYSSNLFAHKRCHTGEKPFECDNCEKCFQTAEQRKRHLLVHTGERPFSCDICGKSFKRRTSLMTHKQSHEDESEEQTAYIEQRVYRSNAVEVL